MEEQFTPVTQPQEVVLEYTPPVQEIVLEYSAPAQPAAPTKASGGKAAAASKPRRKKRWPLLIVCCLALLCAIAFGVHTLVENSLLPLLQQSSPSSGSDTSPGGDSSTTIPRVEAAEGLQMSITRSHGELLTAQEVYTTVNPATVTVVAATDSGSGMVGTGVIFTADGYVLTNFHVIDGGSSCYAMLSTGQSYEANLVAYDDASDIAILKLLEAEDLPTVDFGDSDALTVGDAVYAIGNPLGVNLRGTLTNGIVSATSREVTSGNRTLSVLQTNAALNSGNSGGPLINAYGQVIGINTIKMSTTLTSGSVEGLGFALPTNSIIYVVNDLLTYGYSRGEPTFGMTVSTIATQMPNGAFGLEIQTITTGSAADKAGLQAGDYIIQVDGITVSTTTELIHLRRTHNFGDTMVFFICRAGDYLELPLLLQAAS